MRTPTFVTSDGLYGARSSTTNHPPVQLDSIEVPESRVGDRLRSALIDAVGAEHLLDSAADRILRAGGKSYPDLVRVRTGHLPYVPDAVALPSTHREVADVVEAAATPGSESRATPAAASTPWPPRSPS